MIEDPAACVVGLEHEYKWPVQVSDLDDDVLARHLSRLSEPVTATQGTVYLDDAAASLTTAGHALRIAANQGRLASVSWLGVKQTVRWTGRRDALEISERIPPHELGATLAAGTALPLVHIRRYRMVSGPLEVVAVTSQTRRKRFGDLRCGHQVAISADLVELRAPGSGIATIGHYSCLEIELNNDDPECLRYADALAADVDTALGVARESRTKAQVALEAARQGKVSPA